MQGRVTGSAGERRAADYIIAELKRIGARPLPGRSDYRMPFEFTAGARDGGKLRLEGKDYVVADGDVMHFRFAT